MVLSVKKKKFSRKNIKGKNIFIFTISAVFIIGIILTNFRNTKVLDYYNKIGFEEGDIENRYGSWNLIYKKKEDLCYAILEPIESKYYDADRRRPYIQFYINSKDIKITIMTGTALKGDNYIVLGSKKYLLKYNNFLAFVDKNDIKEIYNNLNKSDKISLELNSYTNSRIQDIFLLNGINKAMNFIISNCG